MRPVRVVEPRRDGQQRHRRAGPRLAVQLPRRRRDLPLEPDEHRVFRGQRGERLGQLGPARREPRKDGSLLVEEVPRDGPLEEVDRAVDRRQICGLGAPGREPTGRVEQARHHLVVTAVRALELGEAGKLHGPHDFMPEVTVSTGGGGKALAGADPSPPAC